MTSGNNVEERLKTLILSNLFSRYGREYLQQGLADYTTPEEQIEPLIQHILNLFKTDK